MSKTVIPEDSPLYSLIGRDENGPGVTKEGLQLPILGDAYLSPEMKETHPAVIYIKEAYQNAISSVDQSILMLQDESFLEQIKLLDERLNRIELTLLIDHIGFGKDKELKALEKKRKEYSLLNNFTPQQREQVLGELQYIKENLPSLDEFSDIVLLATAFTLGATNATVSWAGKHAITAYLGYLAANETNPITKNLLSFTTIYSVITNFLPFLPSISGGLRLLFYYIPGQTASDMSKKLFSNRKSNNRSSRKEDFLSLSKLSLVSGIGVFTIIPLEVLRIFDLKEVSLNTIKLWGAVHALKNFKKDIL